MDRRQPSRHKTRSRWSARPDSLFPVETTERRTVYLDINHWYALGKAMAGHPQEPEHVDVLHQLSEQVEQRRIMIPLSAVNYIELSENPRDHQREEAAKVMTLLGRFRTITSTKRIFDEELWSVPDMRPAQVRHWTTGRQATRWHQTQSTSPPSHIGPQVSGLAGNYAEG